MESSRNASNDFCSSIRRLRDDVVGDLVVLSFCHTALLQVVAREDVVYVGFDRYQVAHRDVARQKTTVIHLDLRGLEDAEVGAAQCRRVQFTRQRCSPKCIGQLTIDKPLPRSRSVRTGRSPADRRCRCSGRSARRWKPTISRVCTTVSGRMRRTSCLEASMTQPVGSTAGKLMPLQSVRDQASRLSGWLRTPRRWRIAA